MSGKSADCCVARPVRPIVWTPEDIGHHRMILEHDCKCGSCCRRVGVWQVPELASASDDFIAKVIAKVIFGCRSSCFSSKVEVDVKQGVVLDLFGDFIQVMLEPVEISGTLPPIAYGAMSACCGAGAARGCATRTLPATLLAGTAITRFKVPPYAYAVAFASPQSEFLFVDTVDFYQLGSGTNTVLSNASGDTLPDPWMLVNGVQYIGIDPNIAGEGTIQVEPVFLIGV